MWGRGGTADAADLKSADLSRVGSNPTAPTIETTTYILGRGEHHDNVEKNSKY